MTHHTLRPRCIVDAKELPAMTRRDALNRNAATEIQGRTYYHCVHHTRQEIEAAIAGRPKFVTAGSLK
nr:hypothetical protein [uncultured Methanoregula sp.]